MIFIPRAQLLDIVAATQTSASWEAALELLDFSNDDQAETIEKFLVNAAFNSHPTEAKIQKIFVSAPPRHSPKLKQTKKTNNIS